MTLTYPRGEETTKSYYIPLMYLHKIKRPGENYIVKTILMDDLLILLFAFGNFNASFSSSLNILPIALLTLSFWCIYDFGYYENDLVAAKYEKDPKLSDKYYSELTKVVWWQPWCWAILFAVVGTLTLGGFVELDALLLNADGLSSILAQRLSSSLPLWLGFLLVSRFVFFVYNYVNKQTRIWLYPLLQFSRYCGLMLLLPINLVGISAILGHVLARSTTYVVYRFAGANNWPKFQDLFLRWLLFVLILSTTAFTQSAPELLYSWQALIIGGWWLFKCRNEIVEIVKSVKPVWD